MNVVIIQARENSKRFPNKVLKTIKNKTVLEWVYDRCEKSNADKIIIATSKESPNIIQLCENKGMEYFIGNEDDVLDRYYQCAKKYKATNIIRITSDCPLVDYNKIDQLLRIQESNNNAITTNCYIGEETYPDGYDVTVINMATLQDFWNKATGKHREHVVTYYTECEGLYKIEYLKSLEDLSHVRVTLDYEDDLEVIRKIYDVADNDYFGYKEFRDIYRGFADIFTNNHKRNEGYV